MALAIGAERNFFLNTNYTKLGNILYQLFQIDRSVGRYKLTDGILQVVNLYKSDSGIYICTADNGIGAAAVKEFTLTVKGK